MGCGSMLHGSVTFTAPDGRYLWYTVEMSVEPPPCARVAIALGNLSESATSLRERGGAQRLLLSRERARSCALCLCAQAHTAPPSAAQRTPAGSGGARPPATQFALPRNPTATGST